jgi:Domain of unknown function (DU1801)
MAELKTKLNDASVETFLASVDESRRQDCAVVLALMQKVTKSPPKMWGTSIIGFGTYTYKYESGREGDWPLVSFSPRKQNLTLYIMAGFVEYEGLMKILGKHTTGKSCLYIKQLSDVDLKVLEKLVKASVEYMKAKYPA